MIANWNQARFAKMHDCGFQEWTNEIFLYRFSKMSRWGEITSTYLSSIACWSGRWWLLKELCCLKIEYESTFFLPYFLGMMFTVSVPSMGMGISPLVYSVNVASVLPWVKFKACVSKWNTMSGLPSPFTSWYLSPVLYLDRLAGWRSKRKKAPLPASWSRENTGEGLT